MAAGPAAASSESAKDKNASWHRMKRAIAAAPATPAGDAARAEYAVLTGTDSKGMVGRKLRLNKMREAWMDGLAAKTVTVTIQSLF